jgi:hypothetical protein
MARLRRPTLEVLEDRTAPAVYGMPWPDARHLTLSFAPDGTQIAGHTSNLFQTLNAQMPTAVWQRDILGAVQTWAVQANISVGVVGDNGQPFGSAPPPSGSPGFGDIRIGAQLMGIGALSVSVPHDPFAAGSWSGAVFLNSGVQFTTPQTDLSGVLLHEMGHVFGLPENNDPNSVLYRHATVPKTTLSPADILAIQALYGTRAPDPNDGPNGNSTFATATPLGYGDDSESPGGTTPLIAFGDLAHAGEVDMFALQSLPGYKGAMTVRLDTAGISLLEPRLTVYDGAGHVLGQAQSTNALGDVVTVHLNQVSAGGLYYVGIDGGANTLFAMGRYGLAVTFDGKVTLTPAQIDSVLQGPYDTLPPDQLGEVLSGDDQALFNTDYPAHSQFATALPLSTSPGYAAGRHYNVIDGLGAGGSAYYLIHAPPSGAPGSTVLTVAVSPLGAHGLAAQVAVFDAAYKPVAAVVLDNGSGNYAIQAGGLQPGAAYYLVVTTPNNDSESEASGNFSVVVDFGQSPQLLSTFAHGTLTNAAPQKNYALYVAQNQLFHFVLSADAPGAPPGAPPGSPERHHEHHRHHRSDDDEPGTPERHHEYHRQDLSAGAPGAATGIAVEMTITDALGNVVFSLTAPAGQVMTADAFVTPGPYTIQFTALTPNGPAAGSIFFDLRGTNLSDPIGQTINDPTLQPIYTSPSDPFYHYPGGIVSTSPFYIVALGL